MKSETAGRIRGLVDRGIRMRMIVYDLFPLTNPEWVTADNQTAFREALDVLLPISERTVVLSEYVAQVLKSYYPAHAESVRVAVPTLEAHAPTGGPARADTESPVQGRFLLALSTVEPRKNHRAILDAWALARIDDRLADVSLAIVGRRGWMADDIEAEIARDGKRLNIRRVDRANDAQVEALFRECLATVHASWAEGYGLPVRESVARGIPTIVSSGIPTDGLPSGTYQVFDPLDAQALARLMVEAALTGHLRAAVDLGGGTGWEPVLSALVD